MTASFRVVSAPTSEPLRFAEVAAHLRLSQALNDDSPAQLIYPDEALVRLYLSAARQFCEQRTARALAPQTIQYVASEFPSDRFIELQYWPVNSVLEVAYLDGDGADQVFASSNYQLDSSITPARLYLVSDAAWPTTQTDNNSAVTITYSAGYNAPDDSPLMLECPAPIKQAMLLLIGHWYENREAVNIGSATTTLDFAVDALLRFYDLRKWMA